MEYQRKSPATKVRKSRFGSQRCGKVYSWQLAFAFVVLLIQGGLISQPSLGEHRSASVGRKRRPGSAWQNLARVMRFSTAGELTASIAHEINQPLGSILTNAETAQAILKSPNPDIVELNEIVGDIVRMIGVLPKLIGG